MLASSKTDRMDGSKSDLTSLRALLGPHLSALEGFLREEAEQFEPEIRELVRYCLGSGGKRIRGSLVFLSAWREDGEVRDDLVRLAAVLELVHLATLVHDDILDSAATRHSRMTASRKYGPSTAVLLGDAIFAHAVNLSTRFPDTEVCQHVSIATRRVCVGEIAQTLRRGSVDIAMRDYYRIVDLKTAELFAAACFLGARLGGYSQDFVDAASRFGRHIGIGYQIYDDLVDFFGDEKSVGKTLGTDLQSGKLTLPLILLLDDMTPAEKDRLRRELGAGHEHVLADRAQEMMQRGIYERVVAAILDELNKADEALAPFVEEAPVPLLMQIQDRLGRQVAALGAEG
jgi:octaprenyl-diphosphate synthase